ncbi:unnamed protein product, partial [Nesidiocoris tenuis]
MRMTRRGRWARRRWVRTRRMRRRRRRRRTRRRRGGGGEGEGGGGEGGGGGAAGIRIWISQNDHNMGGRANPTWPRSCDGPGSRSLIVLLTWKMNQTGESDMEKDSPRCCSARLEV